MSVWRATKARRVLRALLSIGWTIKRSPSGSHWKLQRTGYPDYTGVESMGKRGKSGDNGHGAGGGQE